MIILAFLVTHPLAAHKVGLCIVATGKYIQFVPPLLTSARKHFCKNQHVTYFVFTDGQLQDNGNDVVVLPWNRLGWPYDTMMRFLAYYNNFEHLQTMDYIFACDADLLFVDDVGDEILSDLVASQSPGYIGKRGTYEERRSSTAYVAPYEGTLYFAGGLYGGTTAQVYALLHEVLTHISEDLKNNIIAVWHDESHLNRYFIDHKPTLILPREYLARPWDSPQRLMILVKDHDAFRQ